jgi:uncharacterized protein (DUF885 family)
VVSEASTKLAALAARYWESVLAYNPTFATYLGDRRFDEVLEDRSDEARRAQHAGLTEIREAVDAIAPSVLEGEDQITRSSLVEQTIRDQAEIDADLEAWSLDPSSGPQATALDLADLQAIRTPAEGTAMVARWRSMGAWFDHHISRLRESAAAGRVSARSPALRTLNQITDVLAHQPEDLPLLSPLKVEHASWSPMERSGFDDELRAAVEDDVRPALTRYRDAIRDYILPIARPDDKPGLVHVPGGPQAYRALVRVHTSLTIDPDEIHRIGLDEVARIDEELAALGSRVVGISDLSMIRGRLRADPEMHFSSRDEVQGVAEAALERAREAVPAWFGLQPKADCVVVPMKAHEEDHTTVAYYRQPATDGSRPGQYLINTSKPETRPRYEAETLAFHEAVPGHHLQLAISQELSHLPEFRRHTGVTAFVEGWGLYAERLSAEIGLYSSDLDRIGILSFDGWRASRLVVDTGMHARGWTRQQAVDFMHAHTALASNNIENEIDRYITWPGQALAYKLGQREILSLRQSARDQLRSAFDIRAFHDDVLGHGVVSLPTLRLIVETGIRDRGGATLHPG